MKSCFIFTSVRLFFQILFFWICVLGFFPTAGNCVPNPMDPPRMVNDFAKLLTQEEESKLEQQLREFEIKNGTQIYIVTVNSTEGMNALEFATQIGNAWGVGQEDIDNGVVLLIKPKTSNEKGEVAIALGKGVEKFLSSREASEIINNSLIPLFKHGLFAEGIQQATHSIQLILNNKFTAPPNEFATSPDEQHKKTQSSTSNTVIYFIIGGILLFLIILVLTGHANIAGKICLGLFAIIGALFAAALLLGGTNKTKGRGKFSGGGGGKFGGGGASGSW